MNNFNKTLLLISYDFPPSTGGIARLCNEIVTNMQDYFRQIQVLTILREGIAKPYNADEKINIKFLPKQRGKAELAAIKYLKNISDKENYIVLCGIWHPDAALAMLAGMPNIYILAHGTELLHGKSIFRKYFWHPIYAKFLLGNATKVIANSHFTEKLVKNINCKAKTVALPLGVNPDFFKPLQPYHKEKNILKICSVSRILQFKGHDFILKTLENLPENYLNRVEWNIAGTGPFLNSLKALVKKGKMKNQIHFHGFVPDENLPNFYNLADLFVLATREQKKSIKVEGFGLVFLEAQACGLPVIGTNTGGISDAVKVGEGGWLIQQDNQKQLEELIVNLIENPNLLYDQSQKARKRVEQDANWKKYSENLSKILMA